MYTLLTEEDLATEYANRGVLRNASDDFARFEWFRTAEGLVARSKAGWRYDPIAGLLLRTVNGVTESEPY